MTSLSKSKVLKYGQALMLIIFMVCPYNLQAQSFAPQVGIFGSTAIHKDSSIIIDWAWQCKVKRGFLFIEDTTYQINNSNKASFGNDSLAVGKADGTMNVVSLGDGGEAVLTFKYPIIDGEGADFVVFENGFKDLNNDTLAFLELAFVEVSQDGENFYRFPAICELPDSVQVGTFDKIDARFIHNLAGKYIVNYGTPFDLAEIKQTYPNSNLQYVRYVKIIDVIGTINELYAQRDFYGNKINDPYPTPFASGGFDLDAVGVIHNILENQSKINVFPNPAHNFIQIYNPTSDYYNVKIYTADGKIIFNKKFFSNFITINFNFFYKGLAIIEITTQDKIEIFKIVLN